MKKFLVIGVLTSVLLISGSRAWAGGDYRHFRKHNAEKVCFLNGFLKVCYVGRHHHKHGCGDCGYVHRGHGRSTRICRK